MVQSKLGFTGQGMQKSRIFVNFNCNFNLKLMATFARFR